MVMTTRLEGQLSVDAYPDVLLRKATALHADGEHGIATVVAHMACEVAVERTISATLDANFDAAASEALLAMFNGYGLNDGKQRALYSALTRHEIQREPFWQSYKSSVGRRNRVVHGKHIATQAEGAETLRAAELLLACIKR